MDKKEIYYVCVCGDGLIARIAKFVGAISYGYGEELNEWIEMPSLVKIRFDIIQKKENK